MPQTPERLTDRSLSTVWWSCRDMPGLHPLFRMSPATRVKYDKEGRTACPDCRRQAYAQERARTRHDVRRSVPALAPLATIGFDPEEDLPF